MPANECPACGVIVLKSHVCHKAVTKQPLGPKAETLRACGQCDKGWIERQRADGTPYVVRCPYCGPRVRSNRRYL